MSRRRRLTLLRNDGRDTEADPSDVTAAVGDVTGDGRPDLYAAPVFGTGYVVSLRGRVTGTSRIGRLARFRIKRAARPVREDDVEFLQSAPEATGAGDLDGDGIGDLLLNAPLADALNARRREPLAWLVWGRRSGTVALDRLGRHGVVVARR